MVLYTVLPEVWDAFERILAISPVGENGFTLMGARAYLEECDHLQVTHRQFWDCMVYFLSRLNNKFMERKKMKMLQQKRG